MITACSNTDDAVSPRTTVSTRQRVPTSGRSGSAMTRSSKRIVTLGVTNVSVSSSKWMFGLVCRNSASHSSWTWRGGSHPMSVVVMPPPRTTRRPSTIP